MPIWGWPLLAVGIPLLAILLGLLGGSFVLPTASWREGVLWGLLPVGGVGGLLALARVRSTGIALIVALLVFTATVVLGQYFHHGNVRHAIAVAARTHAGDGWPEAWASLPAAEIYRAWQRDALGEPTAGGWWDGLRAQAEVGITNRERLGPRRTGSPYGDVERRGWLVWGNWLVQHLMLALGTFAAIGLAPIAATSGKAATEPPTPQTERDREAADDDAALRARAERARAEAAYREVVAAREATRAAARDRPPKLTLASLSRAIAGLDRDAARQLREDLLLAWALAPERSSPPAVSDAERDAMLALRFEWRGRSGSGGALQNTDAILLAAGRLRDAGLTQDLYSAVQAVHAVAKAHIGHQPWMPVRPALDLSDLDFPRVEPDPRFDDLLHRRSCFDADADVWPSLSGVPEQDMPPGAFPAILVQLSEEKDARLYDGLRAELPSQLVRRLGGRLRFAELTAVERIDDWFPHYAVETRQALLSRLRTWPAGLALPVADRALRCGWLQAVNRVPQTQAWAELLARHHPSPFGDLASYVPWLWGRIRRGTLPKPD